MNYRFFWPNRFIAAAIFWLALLPLSAQTLTPLPDSIPHPDSLSEQDLSVWTVRLLRQAEQLETHFSRNAQTSTASRDMAEHIWKTAKQDTLTSKTMLDSLADNLKTAKNVEKTASKQQKRASEAVAFAEKMANMNAIYQRRNLRKLWKQVKELDAILHPPPPEKPIAAVIGTEGVAAPSDTLAPSSPNAGVQPSDSADVAATATDKRKNKKPEKATPKYKTYDPAADVMLNPPQRPCALAVSTRDEFSGETYRETQREEAFRFTNDVLKKILPPGQPHIICEAALSVGGTNIGLHLNFNIRDANARKAFGGLARNSVAILKFIDGTTFTVNNLRNDDGTPDPSGQGFNYRAQYILDPGILKKLRKNELDKIRVAWNTGYEDYDVQNVDVLMRQAKCLFD